MKENTASTSKEKENEKDKDKSKKEPEPLPPVLVKMFKSDKPDAAIQGDMDKLET